MSTVLIVDPDKSSVVMTSEVFKDVIPGIATMIAADGKECLQLVEEHNYDLIVVDFDLPDCDGLSLSQVLRKKFEGPILLTAFKDQVLQDALGQEGFAYNDVMDWVVKPVRFDALSEKIELYLNRNRRVRKRFEVDAETLIVGKGAGRGKRAPKASGKIINISIGGALVKSEESIKLNKGDEVTVMLDLKNSAKGKKPAKAKLKITKGEKPNSNAEVVKIRSTIAWTSNNKEMAGVQFLKMTEAQKRSLEGILRNAPEIEEDLESCPIIKRVDPRQNAA